MQYEVGDEVAFWFNKIGPYHNPQETYSYYSLPFCQPTLKPKMEERTDSLGVVLEGDELTDSGLLVKFKQDVQQKEICAMKLTVDQVNVLTLAVQQHYWYQMYVDELPIWGMVGEYMMEEAGSGEHGSIKEQGFIYTHRDFSISTNHNQIIEVNLTSENPKPLTPDTTVAFTYSVHWTTTNKEFASRFDRYLDFDFFEHQIHWFSIFNSFMMVVFLCGLVALILMRTLRQDYIRYSNEDEEMELDKIVDESGWKQIHGDVFRQPSYLMLYAALLGTGYQLFALALCVIGVTLFATMYDERGSMMTSFLICYILTSLIAGYTSSSFYKRYNGSDWKSAMLLTALLYPGVCFSIAFLLNIIAVSYDSSASYSLYTLTLLVALWLFACCPLLLIGTIIGRSTSVSSDFPCRVNTLRRPIPDGKVYTKSWVMSLFAGVLPFGSIFIEMYFIFTSFWNYKFYYVYGFMFLVFLILLVVTVCVTIVTTYVLLNAEDYRWHWNAFMSGGSTALYVFCYAIYYFFTKTRMSGMMQTSYYFGYMAMFSAGLCVLCGTIGYMGASAFVNKIYQYIKSD